MNMTKTKEKISIVQSIGDPFGKNIANEDLFKHHQFEELRDVIKTSINEKTGMLLTGGPGVGKTVAVRSVTDELASRKYVVVYLGQDRSSTNVLRRFAVTLGIQPKVYRDRLAMQISQWLLDNLSTGGKEIVLVIDEAHLLDDNALEEFRLMTNADYDRESPLTIILMGQSVLRLRLKSTDFESLKQRFRYRYCLEGLDQDETVNYIQRRLEIAGAPSDTFLPDALQYIFQTCQGVPRKINNLCSLAMLKAKSKKLATINAALLKELADLE
jgi:type II secretory pathway predicted ATPase ExeA